LREFAFRACHGERARITQSNMSPSHVDRGPALDTTLHTTRHLGVGMRTSFVAMILLCHRA